MRDIKDYSNFRTIEPVNKGWSTDRKYYIETKDDRKLLLRVAEIAEYDRKKAEYKLSIIVFNRPDYGDPWEEFNRIVWSASASPYFATGQLNGSNCLCIVW